MKRTSWELLGRRKPASELETWAENGLGMTGYEGRSDRAGDKGLVRSSRRKERRHWGAWWGAWPAGRGPGGGAAGPKGTGNPAGGRQERGATRGPRRDGHSAGRHAREIGVTCSAVWQLRAGAAGREIPDGRQGCGVGAVGRGRAGGTSARAGAPCTRGPRAREAQSGDNGRSQRSGEKAVEVALRRGPPRGPGSG